MAEPTTEAVYVYPCGRYTVILLRCKNNPAAVRVAVERNCPTGYRIRDIAAAWPPDKPGREYTVYIEKEADHAD